MNRRQRRAAGQLRRPADDFARALALHHGGDAVAAAALCRRILQHEPMSLPWVFGTTLETIPQGRGYLAADDGEITAWAAWLGPRRQGKRVGLAWAGGKTHQNDRNRSIALEHFRPLFDVAGLEWLSLQVGERAGDIAKLPPGAIHDVSRALAAFLDTAALVANLDLVFTVDTSSAHLAGAVGGPTWVLPPYAPDWRWLLGRPDSPWYPSLRLYRQSATGDWPGVIERLVRELLAWRGDSGLR